MHFLPPAEQLEATAVELLQSLIRLGSVNDGSVESGQEIRATKHLEQFFADVSGDIELTVLEPAPGRASLIARLPGSGPTSRSLGLVGHLDVVSADAAEWQYDPFGAELVDGEIWGRGAVDMLFLTAIYATLFREFARAAARGERLAGDLVFMGVADEEGGSNLGMKWLAEHHRGLITVDEVLTEAGGMRIGERVAVSVAEKGSAGRRLHLSGRPGHGSAPYGSDNPIARIGEVVERVTGSGDESASIHPLWVKFVDAQIQDAAVASQLRNPHTIDSALPTLGALAGYAHAITRTSVTPTVVRAGKQHNMIPGAATIDLDIRPLPGSSADDVDRMLVERLGSLADVVRIERLFGWEASASPTDSGLYRTLESTIFSVLGAETVPIMAAGGSDARFFRYLGIEAYGFAMLSEEWSYERYRSRIHTHDERIDLASISLTISALSQIVSKRLQDEETR